MKKKKLKKYCAVMLRQNEELCALLGLDDDADFFAVVSAIERLKSLSKVGTDVQTEGDMNG